MRLDLELIKNLILLVDQVMVLIMKRLLLLKLNVLILQKITIQLTIGLMTKNVHIYHKKNKKLRRNRFFNIN